MRLAAVLCVIAILSRATSQQVNTAPNVPPVIKQCFYEGRWFPAGSIIKAGRSVNWCYGTYCDLDGIVRHWDDYNCPPPTGNNPLPSIPNPQHTTSTTTTPRPPTTAPPPTFWFPTTTQASFSSMGCFYQGNFFWAGQDIYNKKRGRRCLGAYCDWNSNVQHWEDDCRYTMPITPSAQQPAFNTPIDRT